MTLSSASAVEPAAAPTTGAPEPGVAPAAGQTQGGWLRVAIALVIAGQGMAFGLAVNQTPPDTPTAFWVLHGILAGSALAVLALLGGPLLRESLAALRAGRIAVDLLFLVSLTGAFTVSVISTLRREGPVFYELVAILLAIYTAGKLLGARSRARALHAVAAVRAEHATCCRIDAQGRAERVAVERVRPGDCVRVAPGETIAVDGVICRGRGLVWTTPLTGEPDPTLREPGTPVFAGMRSVDGALDIEVTAAAGERRLDVMLQAVEQARLAPSRLQLAADRLAARFVPLVVAVSAGTFVFWLWRASLVVAVENSLAVLVVACPCALGLATPLGIWSALVQMSRLGIVARSGDFVDGLAEADVVMFDKTGTLFEPELQVADLQCVGASPIDAAELRGILAAAETGIDHPVAHALRQTANADERESFEAVEAQIVPGAGLRARVRRAADGREYEVRAGTSRFLAESGVALGAAGSDAPERLRRIHVAVDGVHAAWVELNESPRARAVELFDELGRLGLRVEILTGDPAFAATIWPQISRRAGLAPAEKAQHVTAAQRRGVRVVFVGDGLNDAPALAAADVSIAIRQGADLARSNALAVVAGEHLATLPAAVRLARRVRTAIRANLRFALFYNSGAMALAAAGWVHPVLAALLMAGSSAIVSTRVLRAAGSAA